MSQNNEKINPTAGEKCQYFAMFLAHPELKSAGKLACVYLDLSEKEGFCFASQKYLRFRTGMAERTISDGNTKLDALGLFTFEQRRNNPSKVTPNWPAIKQEYAKYIEADKKIRDKIKADRNQRIANNAGSSRRSIAAAPSGIAAAPAGRDQQNLPNRISRICGHNLSKGNHSSRNVDSIDFSVPTKSIESTNSRTASQHRESYAPLRDKNGASHQTGLFKNHKTVNHSKPDSCTDRMNQDLSFQRMLMASFKERDDQEFGTNSIRNAEKGARFRFDKLIRSGVHWRRIETAYANHLKIREDANQFSLPLVSFLSRNGEDISDPDCDLYVPPEVGNSDEPVLPKAGNDNQEPVRKRVSGSDYDPDFDDPF